MSGMEQKSTRVGYKKSRNGCCDEEAPCSACVRHKVPCSLASPASSQSGEFAMASRSRQSSSNPPGPSPLSLFSSSLLASPLDEPDCWITTAELMLHYTTAAYRTLSFADNVIHTFQCDVPRQAIAHPYFLREVLAFSGFHLAYLNPEKKQHYLLLASKHQNLAIRGIREALSGPITSTNCHAIYATSTLIVVNKFAAFPSCEDHLVHGCAMPIQALVEIFSLVNGMDAVLKSPGGADIKTGPLKELFGQCDHAYPTGELLQGLLDRVPELIRWTQSESFDPGTRQVLTSAAESFNNCLTSVNGFPTAACPAEVRAMFWWPMLISRDFLDLAGSSHPLALVILAYYDVLLYWGESRYWFFEDWAQVLISAIVDKVRGSQWEELVSWPAGVILHQE
ncbi:transcription factor [Fusarium albosuccineum]|uniref:Transcription factor n=1 Tax=Fusarium albosuccineum TaxID=1237068 RepID=A0A8H4PKF2_9HYPO|nr:transcription factor [Fusarium albosuccineum]